MFSIANILTALNLFCGCIAIYKVITGEPFVVMILLVLSLILDFADGFVARYLRQESVLGVQLDSLADVVSFGVLPSFMIFSLINGAVNQEISWLVYFAFIPAMMAAFRLARYNVEADGKVHNFQGLPVPAMTMLVSGLYADFNLKGASIQFLYHPLFLIIVSIIVSILMISRIPILKFIPNVNFIKNNLVLIIALIACLIMIALGNYIFISLLIILHILYSFLKLNFYSKK